MAFLRFTNAETGATRVVNTEYVIYVEQDPESEGALIWWISYADAGQPKSKYLWTTEPYEQVAEEFIKVGGSTGSGEGAAGRMGAAERE